MSKKKFEESYVGYEGRVVSVGPHEQKMSDYSLFGMFAVVLMDDGSFKKFSGDFKAEVTASPEMIEAYRATQLAEVALYKAKSKSLKLASADAAAKAEAAKAAKLEADRAKNLALEAGMSVSKGDMVKVLSGKSKGQEGVVFWVGNSARGTKLGVALGEEDAMDGGFHKNVAWVLKKNVKFVA